ncbi:ABC transporter ATP-binding protein [Clostridium frigidicarnis]|uniref:ABC-2 type transport system ATP-binding protein n=1 Tax=Clostridium frigidicarnis TaxID=84698 RepID=A0A1I0W4V6_9CLOT|nr:ABC transporter ATP-binding protein [Clostridium frigidicarnis]SFA83387.1 ABC-2 type transport system ATP-binding protein [Clostridium frigidicarnis]
MDEILEVSNVFKNYGNKEVLKDINFKLKEGKVVGILGPNGQGKTTLLNIIGGLIKPTSGVASIDGINVSYETKKVVSFLQEKNVLYNWMSIKDAINFYKDFLKDFDSNKMSDLLKFMKLEENMTVNKLSKGMLEKLSLSLTLSRKARLYILDEPISGVDTVTRDKIVNVIIDNITIDSSMIITTHYIGELENIFDEVLFLGEGKIIEHGDAEELREKYGTSIEEIYKKIFNE